jgi:hypothetical protein
MVNAVKLGCVPEFDRWWLAVAYAGVSGLSAWVVVVADPFQRSWFGSLSAWPVGSSEDFIESCCECRATAFRGKSPPAL